MSDADFERRAHTMDIYGAVIVDPWTWAGKGTYGMRSSLQKNLQSRPLVFF